MRWRFASARAGERIDLARYTDTLTQVQRALNEIDHVFAQRKTVRPAWIVHDLGHDDQELVVRLSARETPRRDHASLLASIDALVSRVSISNTWSLSPKTRKDSHRLRSCWGPHRTGWAVKTSTTTSGEVRGA
ncbi:hypothetical protein ACSDR0_16200 [Streptosporangium sp. G11]|uniref:hypothetical protein n=1 Tax=Streptosporangium sp. G11 TaxID=3436926 RepID=UPI003EBF674F